VTVKDLTGIVHVYSLNRVEKCSWQNDSGLAFSFLDKHLFDEIHVKSDNTQGGSSAYLKTWWVGTEQIPDLLTIFESKKAGHLDDISR
jgi:hypothetical protein